jgi:predicted DNA binding CopG/RHH family protein
MQNKNRVVQHFSDEYLEECRKMNADQICKFLDDYKKLHFDIGKLKQINLRVPENILKTFQAKARSEGVQYQKKIRELITDWAVNS